MITLRTRMANKRSARMLMPALLFFVCASLSTVGAGGFAALCLIPVALVIDSARDDAQPKDREDI